MLVLLDIDSLKFLDKKVNVPFFKIPSGEIKLHRRLYCKTKKILLSTGMATFEEIKAH